MDRPLRAVFDQDAERYDRARPGYPAELFDDLAALTGLRAGDRVLEIGPGTGQATVPLAQRGYRIATRHVAGGDDVFFAAVQEPLRALHARHRGG